MNRAAKFKCVPLCAFRIGTRISFGGLVVSALEGSMDQGENSDAE